METTKKTEFNNLLVELATTEDGTVNRQNIDLVYENLIYLVDSQPNILKALINKETTEHIGEFISHDEFINEDGKPSFGAILAYLSTKYGFNFKELAVKEFGGIGNLLGGLFG